MRYVWDDDKDAENRRKHGLSLNDGIAALRDPNRIEWIDDRFMYGEERIATIGLSGRRALFVVHAMWAADICRLISVRRATRRERATYGRGDPGPV